MNSSKGVQPREGTRLHRPGFLAGSEELRCRVADHPDVGHAALGGAAPFAWLSDAGGVEFDVGPFFPVIILVPGPVGLGAEGCAGFDGVGQALTGVLGGPLDSRLRDPCARHFFEEFGPFLEAVGDGPGQGGDSLQARGQVAGRQAGVAVEGEQALAADPAKVVSAAVADGPHETERGVPAVRVELGGPAAVRAGYSGAFVAVFF